MRKEMYEAHNVNRLEESMGSYLNGFILMNPFSLHRLGVDKIQLSTIIVDYGSAW